MDEYLLSNWYGVINEWRIKRLRMKLNIIYSKCKTVRETFICLAVEFSCGRSYSLHEGEIYLSSDFSKIVKCTNGQFLQEEGIVLSSFDRYAKKGSRVSMGPDYYPTKMRLPIPMLKQLKNMLRYSCGDLDEIRRYRDAIKILKRVNRTKYVDKRTAVQ